mmetsp:Transcript_31006/g.89355  ORF Transcript_31006/g.89355 Transcript_31006/m.89355 type:complete len:258 (+) Transcript_31006:919-1692(+)
MRTLMLPTRTGRRLSLARVPTEMAPRAQRFRPSMATQVSCRVLHRRAMGWMLAGLKSLWRRADLQVERPWSLQRGSTTRKKRGRTKIWSGRGRGITRTRNKRRTPAIGGRKRIGKENGKIAARSGTASRRRGTVSPRGAATRRRRSSRRGVARRLGRSSGRGEIGAAAAAVQAPEVRPRRRARGSHSSPPRRRIGRPGARHPAVLLQVQSGKNQGDATPVGAELMTRTSESCVMTGARGWPTMRELCDAWHASVGGP